MKRFKDFKEQVAARAGIHFEWIENQAGEGTVIVTGKSNKKASGVFVFASEAIRLELFSSDYTPSYLKRSVIQALTTVSPDLKIDVALHLPGPGSTISTKQPMGRLKRGDVVTLSQGTYYYSVDSDVVDCNGWPLKQNFRAIFQEKVDRRCSPSTSVLPYTLFRLS